MAKKNILINAQDISRIVVTATFEVDIMDNLDAGMTTVKDVLDYILSKANMEEDAVEMAIEATIKEKK